MPTGKEAKNGGIMIPRWLIVAGPIIGTLLGGGVSYGVLSADVQHNKEQIVELRKAYSYMQSIDTRLARLEGAAGLEPSWFERKPHLVKPKHGEVK